MLIAGQWQGWYVCQQGEARAARTHPQFLTLGLVCGDIDNDNDNAWWNDNNEKDNYEGKNNEYERGLVVH